MAHAARFNLRMQKELKLLLTDTPPGVSVPPLSQEEDSSTSCLSSIEARIEGPEETVYSGGIFTIRVQVPERYPFQPPVVTFATPIYHPNIDNGGRICLDILNLPPKGAWQPSLNISTVLTSIRLLLSEPNPDDGLMCEVSREYKYDRQVFDQKARSWTEKYAKAGAFGSNDAGLIGASSKTEAEQVLTGSVAPESNNSEGNRKRNHITRDKLSLRAAAEKSNVDDKENGVPISPPLLPQSKYINMSSNMIDLPKQTVPSAEEQPGKVISSEDSHQNKEDPVETLIVLDSEDSADEDDKRPLRSRLSLVRSRGWKTKQQRR